MRQRRSHRYSPGYNVVSGGSRSLTIPSIPGMLADVPLSLTPFIGRADEVDALVRLVGTTRLVTLTGAGGSGKTRLAGEVARRVRTQFAGGAVWVELAPLADPDLLATYLLDALAIEPGAR